MKVKELIKLLEEQNQDAAINVSVSDDGGQTYTIYFSDIEVVTFPHKKHPRVDIQVTSA